MPKYYKSVKLQEETYRKIIEVKGKLEQQTKKRHSLDETVRKALDFYDREWL